MKKLIFILIFLSATQAFGKAPTRTEVIFNRDVLGVEFNLDRGTLLLDRTERNRGTRSARYAVDIKQLSPAQVQYLQHRRLVRKYPLAAERLGRIEPFSYFGFLLHEVKSGERTMESFLQEYENYLTNNN